MDEFYGRAYVFLPCYLTDRKLESRKSQQSPYIEKIIDRFSEEITDRSWNKFQRSRLDRFSFDFYGQSEKDKNCKQLEGDVQFTLNKQTQLCVLTIIFRLNGEPVTQFLDRVSREDIKINNNTDRNINFYDYLESQFGVRVAGKARVCLSTGREIPEELKPSIFANEMYESDVMQAARLLPSFENSAWKENIAVYDSSSIFASKTTVVRYDTNLDDSIADLCGTEIEALGRDIMLTFIIEILMFREASIKRANIRVISSIQNDENMDLTDINDLMTDFKSAILFWDLDIFLYPSAQQLADNLFSKFDIDRSLETYRKNQSYLEQRVNLTNAIQAENETRTINYIAIIVFFFEVVPLLFVLAQAVVEKKPVSIPFIYSGGIALTTSILLFTTIVFIVRSRKLKSRAIK